MVEHLAFARQRWHCQPSAFDLIFPAGSAQLFLAVVHAFVHEVFALPSGSFAGSPARRGKRIGVDPSLSIMTSRVTSSSVPSDNRFDDAICAPSIAQARSPSTSS